MLENSMGVPQNIENKTVIDPGISLLGIYLKGGGKKTQIKKTTSTPVFMAALLTIVRVWKQPKC